MSNDLVIDMLRAIKAEFPDAGDMWVQYSIDGSTFLDHRRLPFAVMITSGLADSNPIIVRYPSEGAEEFQSLSFATIEDAVRKMHEIASA